MDMLETGRGSLLHLKAAPRLMAGAKASRDHILFLTPVAHKVHLGVRTLGPVK